MAQKRNMSSSLKPDYFIAHNGLPNILTTKATRHVIRQTTTTTANSLNRMHNKQKNSCTHTHDNSSIKSQKNRQNLLEVQEEKSKRPCLKKSEKDLINYESKSSHRQGKLQNRLNNDTTVLSMPPKKFETDKESSIKRRFKETGDNKFTHQRKYDNTIFRHGLPNRIILPPLPL